ncbi:hypothetical protein JCGZ_07160 [Jatropha curcas]|uniref:C2 NT-type domain-containing protein n=1 Tax=Jatropha curcas TaxID=180498 RepID=A0A067KP58_JATCU|nr:uncharacterized protein LOC105637633 [Jatropha curcas]KDP33589.1 hypothetical protein JCGZ_07160 [Jatropha curcas]
MKKLSSWLPGSTKKLHVKVKPLKLEGVVIGEETEDIGKERIVAVEMEWKGPKSRLVPFYRVTKWPKNYSSHKFLKKGGEPIEWNEEFENICNFSIASKDDTKSFGSWAVSFKVIYGEDAKSKTKMKAVGQASLNMGELGSSTDSEIEKKLPIALQIDGVVSKATLSICVSFPEARNSTEPAADGIVQNSTEFDNKEGIFSSGNCGTTYAKNIDKEDTDSSSDSNESTQSISDGLSGNESITTSENANNADIGESGSSLRAWTQRNSSLRSKLSLWAKQRRFLVLSRRRKPQKDDNCIASREDWEKKELVSRDGQAKLKANVFFASFDQRSQKAAGESACSTLVTVIAHWLQTNKEYMPTKSQFDSLIAEGSSEWQKLCNDEAYMNSFPDNHFDLETVLKADLRPLSILHNKSFTAIFNPEKFENLKGAMSFDDIWEDISSITEEYDHKVYIVSWNDHFFVLKADLDAYYIIDSLGERLFEGCNQAYILKFDESTIMYEKVRKEIDSEEQTAAEKGKDEQDTQEIICKGKECCKEFIKRFLAAIPLKELEEEEKKRKVSTFSLLQRLQIDFHYSSSSSSSSMTSPTSSCFSSGE